VSGDTPRAVVCGTTFGQVYLEALRGPGAPARLAGILARGSARSAACARRYGVPLFTSLADLPPDVSVACVVVRGGLLGGHGTELAADLMARGVHVLQEHPLHHDELADCLRAARGNGVQYQLNSFYPDLAPVRGFLRAAGALRSRRPVRYLEAACAFQVGYALLDVITAALGRGRPWEFTAGEAGRGPFRSVSGLIGGVPVSLRLQHELDPADPDAGELLLHRVTLGTDAGELSLVSSHGPVVWTDRPRIPSGFRDPDAAPIFAAAAAADDDPCWMLAGPRAAPGRDAAYRQLWPAAAAAAVARLTVSMAAGSDPLRTGQRHLELCRMWQRLAELLGPPARAANPAWVPLRAEDRSALAEQDGAKPGGAAGTGDGTAGTREAAWPARTG
jgi:pyochelin biosynthetic protein PchG